MQVEGGADKWLDAIGIPQQANANATPTEGALERQPGTPMPVHYLVAVAKADADVPSAATREARAFFEASPSYCRSDACAVPDSTLDSAPTIQERNVREIIAESPHIGVYDAKATQSKLTHRRRHGKTELSCQWHERYGPRAHPDREVNRDS